MYASLITSLVTLSLVLASPCKVKPQVTMAAVSDPSASPASDPASASSSLGSSQDLAPVPAFVNSTSDDTTTSKAHKHHATDSSSTQTAWSTTWSATPAASSTSAAASSSSSSGGGGSGLSSNPFTGQATYFTAGLGACGWWNTGSDYIVAVNVAQYQQSNCGKTVTITNPATGLTAQAQIADECPSCGWGALDMSTGLFGYLSNQNFNEGVFQMEWSIDS